MNIHSLKLSSQFWHSLKILFLLIIIFQSEYLFAQNQVSIFVPRASPFWDRFTEFSIAASNDIGLNLTVYNSKNSTDKMIEQVGESVKNNTQGIIFVNYGGVGEPILSIAENNNIPVMLVNTELNDQSLKPRVEYSQWIGSVIPKVEKGQQKLGVGGPFFDGAQAVIMLNDYLNGYDFKQQGLIFSNSMMVTKSEQLVLLKSILENPDIINYKSLSKSHNPSIQNYQFKPTQLETKTTLNLTTKEHQWLSEHPKLKVGVMSAWPPFDFIDGDGNVKGIGVDIIHQINLRLGHQLVITPGNWHDIFTSAKAKKLDLLFDISPNSSRESFFHFTEPYLEVPHVIVANKKSAFLESEESLIGKTLAIEESFVNVSYFQKNYPNVNLLYYGNTNSALEAVSRGDADAYVGNRVVALYLIEQKAFSNLRVHGISKNLSSILTIGVRKDYPILKGILQKALDDITKPKLREIKNKWVHLTELDAKNSKLGLTLLEEKWIKEHETINIGVDGNWPPIDFFDENNQFHGITADYLKEIGELVGLHFIPKKSESFKEMLDKVMTGKLEVGATISYKEERTQHLLFTQPFFHVQKVIMSNKRSKDISDIRSLYGKTVAIEDGFLTMRQLEEQHPEIKLVPVESTLEALRMVSFSKADAYVGNQAVAAWLTQKNQITNLNIVGDPELGRGPQNFAVSKLATEWEPLVSIINKALDHIPENKKFEIENRWLGQIKKSKDTVPKLILTDKEKAWLKQHKTITLGIDATWKPLEFIDEQGDYRGVSSDFMEYFSQQIGLTILKPTKTTWTQVIDQLKTKQLDVAPLLTKTDERSEFLNFTKPYLNFPAVIFNQKGEVLLNGLPDLNGKKVGVVKGYAISELIAQDYPDIQQVYFSSTQEGLVALSTGQVDAYIDMLAVGGYQMVNAGFSNIQVAASVPYMNGNQFRIGVRKDWPELVSILNKAISQLPIEKKNAVLNKWLVVDFQEKTDYILFYWVLGIAVVIFSILSLRAREMKKINIKLQSANEAVEKSSQFKSLFLANMSHEIRTPMNAIVGIGYLMSRTDLNEKQNNYIATLQKSAQSLLSLIDDILDLSKIEAGHLRIEDIEFNLENLLQDLAEISTVKIIDKDIEFIYQLDSAVPLELMGDPFRISQVLMNLVSNAIKFTEAGHIILNIHVIKSQKDKIWLEFEVSDTGIGISKDKLEHLFTPFEQEDNSTTRKYGGTGLGLSICHHLTTLMGGTLTAQSVKGVGSQFTFELPFKTTQSFQKIIKIPESNLKGLNVLLIDDNLQALSILNQMMTSLSFNVKTVTSGEQALEILSDNKHTFDLILVDWRMPGMGGEQTIEAINSMMPVKQRPLIIMMTAYGRDAVELKINELSIDGFLVKPITPSLLFDAVAQAQNNKTAQGEIVRKTHAHNTLISETLKGQVLLAEDNLVNQQVAKEILQQMGLDVWICDTGLKVIQLLETKQPDIILMDIQMPEMDGYEATRLIKKNSKTQHIPIIAMTANAMAEDVEKSKTVGMQAHISKPVDPKKLYDVLRQYLHEAGNQRSEVVTQSIIPWPDEVPGLHIHKGIKQVGGNEALYQKLIKDFLNNHGGIATELSQNIHNGKLEKAIIEAHTVKGVTGNIGAERMHDVISKIDEKLKFKTEISDELLASLSESCDELCDSINVLMSENSNSNVASESNNKNDDSIFKVDSFLQMLSNNDAKSHQLVEIGASQLIKKMGKDNYNELKELVDDYEYEEAKCHLVEALSQNA